MKKRQVVALLAIGLVAVSCGDDDENEVPTTGAIEVVTVTTGADIDPDGYTVTVGGVDGPTVGVNSTVTLPNLTAANYSVGLDGIALNCQTTSNPRIVNVVAGQTAPAQFDVTCAGLNLPPVADAGSDQDLVDADNTGFEAVTLDGSGSADAGGTIESWSWSVNGAEFGTGETLTVSADVGTYTVTLTVTDDEGATDTDDVIITVIPTDVNWPPIADAGPAQSVPDADDSGSEAVTLDGSGSTDVDGTIESWSWLVEGAEIGTGETLTTDFDVGTRDVILVVTDDEGADDQDFVRITVAAVDDNLPPVADAGPDQTVVDHDGDGFALVTVDGSGSTDSDGVITDYLWGPPVVGGGETIGANFHVGVHTVTLTVTDNDGATDTDEVVITVRDPIIPPN